VVEVSRVTVSLALRPREVSFFLGKIDPRLAVPVDQNNGIIVVGYGIIAKLRMLLAKCVDEVGSYLVDPPPLVDKFTYHELECLALTLSLSTSLNSPRKRLLLVQITKCQQSALNKQREIDAQAKAAEEEQRLRESPPAEGFEIGLGDYIENELRNSPREEQR
jgi:hypothetical protein